MSEGGEGEDSKCCSDDRGDSASGSELEGIRLQGRPYPSGGEGFRFGDDRGDAVEEADADESEEQRRPRDDPQATSFLAEVQEHTEDA